MNSAKYNLAKRVVRLTTSLLLAAGTLTACRGCLVNVEGQLTGNEVDMKVDVTGCGLDMHVNVTDVPLVEVHICGL